MVESRAAAHLDRGRPDWTVMDGLGRAWKRVVALVRHRRHDSGRGGGGRTASIPMSREKHKLEGGSPLLCSPSFFLLYIQCTPYPAQPLH